MPRGGKRPGSGRPKGSPNKKTAKTQEELWDYIRENGKTNPLQFLIDTVSDKSKEYTLRVQCAVHVAPYMASKLTPVDPETGSAERRIKITVKLSGESDD